ncbi:hypothetical protein [Paraburkholderia phenoliruptrix]|uniref:hypothetical protein n=1 Tax=Paraburkholderia phenoliruptrix TaxID=252970 RepID=UPI001C6EDB61|nr:hypothetical protein [Paraburkholderia phenoliruptrix]MBW9107028.1 hypothetical protein [Paraburkholderia phenoliruptrix]MBW9129480.1 hypothetical protein [Paraburkholderia ginsengiterrae]
MIRTLACSIKAIAWLMMLRSMVAYAAASVEPPGPNELPICFLSVPDWVGVSHIDEVPHEIIIELITKEGRATRIAAFDQDGPALPELVSVFAAKVSRSKILFAIVKWRYYLPGVNTEGDYYEVHAYNAIKNRARNVVFSENIKLSNLFGSGFDGKQEGKIVNFPFKTATAIKKTLNK